MVTRVIAAHTTPVALCLDPFTGTGATGLVCKTLSRSFTGIEINPAHAKVAAHRIGCKTKPLSLQGKRA